MLPLFVTQAPLAALYAISYFLLFHRAFPDAKYDQINPFTDAPAGLIFGLLITNAAYSLFTLVGVAATIVAVRAILQGKRISLSEALDPAFTRMGGLLVLGILFNMLLGITVVGVVVAIYFIVRLALGFHAYILEGAGAWGSLGQSWRLLRGRMLKFTGLLLTVVPVVVGAMLAGSVVMAILFAPFLSDDPARTTGILLNSVAFLVFGLLAVPIGAYLAAATTIFYLSAREESRA